MKIGHSNLMLRRPLSLWVGMILLPLIAGSVGFCQAPDESPPPEIEASEAAETEVIELNVDDPQLFSRSLSFITDRELDRIFQGIQKAAIKKDWPTICDRLVTLQKESPNTLVNVGGVISTVAVAAEHQLRLLPPEALETYRRLINATANEQLKAAILQNDLEALKTVARQYRLTPAADEAHRLIIRSLIDIGMLEDAAIISLRSPELSNLQYVADFLKNQEAQRSLSQTLQKPPAFLSETFPSPKPTWELKIENAPEVINSLSSTYTELRYYGLTPYPAYSLTASKNHSVLGGASHRVAFNQTSGEIAWQREIPGYTAHWLRDPGDLGDRNRRRMFAISVARRTFDESATSRSTSDGKHLYFVETIENLDPLLKPDESGEDSVEGEQFPANRLVCVSATTGEVVWTFDGEPAGKNFFAGPPTIFGNYLYALGESKTTNAMTLFTLDSQSGSLKEALELASPLLSLSSDERRHGRSGTIEFYDGRLLCATAAGALVCVDPLFGELAWAIRLPRKDALHGNMNWTRAEIKATGFADWDSWQEIQLIQAGRHIIFVTPESDFLYCVDPQTGRIVWQQPRGNALCIASASAETGVLLIEKTRARNIDLKSGALLWESPIPQSAGRGVSTDIAYLYPIYETDFARVDLKTGAVSTSFQSSVSGDQSDRVLPRKMQPRQLLISDGTLFEVTPTHVRKLQSPLHANEDSQFASVSQEIVNRIESGNWLSSLGEFMERLKSSSQADPLSTQKLQLALLSAAYEQLTKQTDRLEIAGQISEHLKSPYERAAWRQRQVISRLGEKDYDGFVHLWLETPIDELSVLLPASREDLRYRLDRWLQSQAVALSNSLSAPERHKLSEFIKSRVMAVTEKSVEEQDHISRCLGVTPWGDEFQLRSGRQISTLPEWVDAQLRWISISQNPDQNVSSIAVSRLVHHYVQREQWRDALEWLRRLKSYPSDLNVDGATIGSLVNEYESLIDKQLTETAEFAPWQNNIPSAEVKSTRREIIQVMPASVIAPFGGMMSNMSIEVDYPSRQGLRFLSADVSRPWVRKLPSLTRNLLQDYGTEQIWGFGQFCLFQTGDDLYGITPLNQKDSRISQQIWASSQMGADSQNNFENLLPVTEGVASIRRPGFERVTTPTLSEFGHNVGTVGPVLPTYFCVQKYGMLVAIETATGNELWRRYDLPMFAQCFGNETHLILAAAGQPHLNIYSAMTGEFVKSLSWNYSVDDVIVSLGTTLITVRGDGRTLIASEEEEEEAGDANEEAGPTEEQPTEEQPAEATPTDAKPVEENKENPQPAPPHRDATQPELSPLELESLNGTTGERHWKKSFAPGSIPFELDSKWLGMLSPGGAVEFVDLSSGNTIQVYTLNPNQSIQKIACSVSTDDFLVVFSSISSREDDFFSSSPIPSGYRRPIVQGTMVCFSRETGTVLWKEELGESTFRLDQPVDVPVFVVVSKGVPKVETFRRNSTTIEPVPEDPPVEVPPVDENPENSAPSEPSPETPPTRTEPEIIPESENSPKQATEDTEDEEADEEDEDDGTWTYETFHPVIRCYCRRTGKLIGQIDGEVFFGYSVSGERKFQKVKLISSKSRLEIDFARAAQEPDAAPADGSNAPAPPK
ncbi:PQQ-binding-like beta-propeller repeat protein [Planctomicrobium sp. SH668]|uniref:outer membrane protein assembly factor BamB family protein n=1 Tax=Planctomicrobium sp. SH668 TaxID=3448126 RepID=UPI003F5C98D5